MYFHSLQAMLAMDGHGAFVWSAYLVAAIVVALMVVVPGRRQRRILRELGGELKRAAGGPNTRQEGE